MRAGTPALLPDRSSLELLSLSLAGGSTTAGALQDAAYAPLGQRLIDPLEVAALQSDPRYLLAARAIENARAQRRERQIDLGAAAIDDLAMRFAGAQLNLSGFRKEPRLFYPIAPDVTYETGLQNNRHGGKGGAVEYVAFNDTPMMDWDIPSDSHAARNVSVRHLGDVEELINNYLNRNPQSMVRLYQTPGGFRAWELGQRLDPLQFARQAEDLMVDPDYMRLAQSRAFQEVEGLVYGGPAFSSRISRKPGRPQDWAAQPLLTLTGSDALADPVSLQRVRQYHDEPIRQAYLTANGVNPDALAMLAEQARFASRQFQGKLRLAGLLR